MLEGGSASGQASYVASQFGKDFDATAGGKPMMGLTMDEDMFRNNLRAEAKQRSSAALTNIGEDSAAAPSAESKDGEEKEEIDEEERARRKKERKERKKKKKKKAKKQAMGLLGDLPSLDGGRGGGGGASGRGNFLQLDLELPEKMKKLNLAAKGGDAVPKKGGLKANELTPTKYFHEETGVPSEFACAINGHLMKEPVRTPGGIVFEKDTILLWIKTRGQVCPISGDALTEDMLEEDKDLGSEILRWNIKKTAMGGHRDSVIGIGGGEVEDDVYDF
jgi:hypothetical protein